MHISEKVHEGSAAQALHIAINEDDVHTQPPPYREVGEFLLRLFKYYVDCGYHFIVMEYCDLGNLMQYQSKIPQRVFGFAEALRILHQVMKGVEAIHNRNIIHRDLKCENIFLQRNKNKGFTCKIGDFGFAKVVENTTKTSCGTIYFMAPEVIEHRPYDRQADIWSIGVIFYYSLFGEYPFKCNDPVIQQ